MLGDSFLLEESIVTQSWFLDELLGRRSSAHIARKKKRKAGRSLLAGCSLLAENCLLPNGHFFCAWHRFLEFESARIRAALPGMVVERGQDEGDPYFGFIFGSGGGTSQTSRQRAGVHVGHGGTRSGMGHARTYLRPEVGVVLVA